jgi:hypothetical protein
MSRTRARTNSILSPPVKQGQSPPNPWILDPPGGGRAVDFSCFAPWGALGLRALKLKTRNVQRHHSLREAKKQLRHVFRIIAETCTALRIPRPTTPAELTETLVLAVLDSFESQKNWSAETGASNGAMASYLFRRLIAGRFEIPVVPAADDYGRVPVTISDADGTQIFHMAENDIEKSRSRLAWVAALREGASERDIDKHGMSAEDLIAYWIVRMGGVPHVRADLIATGHKWFWGRVFDRGLSMFEVHRTLYPAPEDAVPFILILVEIYGFNPRSVLDLGEDCCDGRLTHYIKYRAGGTLVPRQLTESELNDVDCLLRTWAEMTKDARAVIAPKDRKWFWLVLKRFPRGRGLLRPMNYEDRGDDLFLEALKRWCTLHSVRPEVRKSLMSKLRKFAGRKKYLATAGSGVSSQVSALNDANALLNHNGESPLCYSLAMVTLQERLRAINETDERLDQKLVAYGV